MAVQKQFRLMDSLGKLFKATDYMAMLQQQH